MRPVWLFEADVFGTSAEPTKAEVRRQGMTCTVTRQRLLASGIVSLPEDVCVIACGSYPFVHHIQVHRHWVPGGWCDAARLACSAYSAHFGRYWLNRRYTLLPGVEAIRTADVLFDTFGRGGEVFVRPDGCQKLFTGRRVKREDFAAALAPARYDPATLVLVAEPRDIAREWRLVIAGDEVIAASQYLIAGRIDVEAGCPEMVRTFAEEMLAAVPWRPDPIFMLDVSESDGDLYLLELGGFSCCALYACDPKAVVSRASELAERAWQDCQPSP